MKSLEVTKEMIELAKRAGNPDANVAVAAQREIANAFTLPLREGVLDGDISGGIYTEVGFEPGQAVEFPLDFIAPGSERDLVAFTIPIHGRIPEEHFSGDYVSVPTFDVGASADTNIKYVRDSRWDVLARLNQAIEAMFVRRKNLDAWHTILGACVTRNLVAVDDYATEGLFTKRLIANAETYMTRGAGGNTNSMNRGKLTDVYMSIESRQDVLSWDLTQIPDALRQSIYLNWSNGGIARIGSVNLHELVELGVDQEFQTYVTDALGLPVPSGRQEFAVGLDLRDKGVFLNPVREEVKIFEDPTFHRQRRVGFYGWREHGFSILDSRRVMLLAI